MGILDEVYGSNGSMEDMLSQIRNNAAMMNERDRQIAMQNYGVGNILMDVGSTGFKGVTSTLNYLNTAPEYFRNVLYKGFNNFSEPDPRLREAFNQTMDKELLKSFGERQARIEEYMPENPNSRIMTDKLSNVGQDALRAVAGLGTGALGFAGDLTKNTLVKAPAAVAAPLMDKPLDNDLIAFSQQSPIDVFSSALALPMEEGKEPGALERSMHKFFGGVQKSLKPVHEFGTWAAQESGHPVPELVGDLAGSAAEALAFEAAAKGGKYAYGKAKSKVEKVLENSRLMREEKAAKQLEELEAKNKADAELLNSMSKADEVAGVEPPPGSVEGPSNLLDINKLKNKDLQLEVKQKQLEENLSKMREERNYLVDEGELKTIDGKIGKVEKERETIVANRAKYAEKIRENDPSTYDAENAIKSDRERAVDSEAEAKSAEANVATKETLEDTLKAYSEYLDIVKKGQSTKVLEVPESESAPLVKETRRASDLIDVEDTANYEVLSAKLDEVSAMVDKLRTPTESVSVTPEVSAVEPTTLQIETEFNPADYSLKSKEFKELSAVQKKQVYDYHRQQKIAEKEAKQTGEDKSGTVTATIKKKVVPETPVETKTEAAPTPEVDLTTIRVNSKEYKGLTKEQKLAVREINKAKKAEMKKLQEEMEAEEKRIAEEDKKKVEEMKQLQKAEKMLRKGKSTHVPVVSDRPLGKGSLADGAPEGAFEKLGPKLENKGEVGEGSGGEVTTNKIPTESSESSEAVSKLRKALSSDKPMTQAEKLKQEHLDKLREHSDINKEMDFGYLEAIEKIKDPVELSKAIENYKRQFDALSKFLDSAGKSKNIFQFSKMNNATIELLRLLKMREKGGTYYTKIIDNRPSSSDKSYSEYAEKIDNFIKNHSEFESSGGYNKMLERIEEAQKNEIAEKVKKDYIALDKTLSKPKIENGIDEKVTTKEAPEAPPLVIKDASKLKAEVAKEKVDKQKAVLDKLEESSNAIHQMEDTVDLSEAITKLEATHTKLENELRQQGLSNEAVEAHPIIQKVKEVRAKYEAAWEALPEDIKNSLDAEPIKVAKESVSPVSRPFREILRDIATVFKDETGAVGNLSDILPKEVLEAKARLKEDAARLGRSLADHLKILGVKPDVIAMMTGEVPRVAGVTTDTSIKYESTKAVNDTKVRYKTINDGTTYALSKPPVFVNDIVGMLNGKDVKFGALVNVIHSFEKVGTYAKEKLFDRFNELDTNKKRESVSYEHITSKIRNSLSREENANLRLHMLARRGGGDHALARNGVDISKIKPLNARQIQAAKIMETHYRSLFDRINEVRAKNGLQPFDRVENYTTFFTDMDVIAEHMNIDPINMDLDAFDKARSFVNDISFKFANRAHGRTALDLSLHATEAFSKYVNKALHQIHMQPLVSFTKELLGDFKYHPLTGEKMKFGTWSLKDQMPDTAAGISKWINAVARNSKELGDLLSPTAARMISKYQHLNTLGTLAYRATTVLAQPSSLATVPMYIGAKALHIMPRALDIMFPKNYKLAEKLSNVLSSRTFTQEVADLISSIKDEGLPGMIKKVALLGMKPMGMLDTGMAYYTWQMGFKEARGRGLNMEKAARYADDLVLKTQASGNIGHVAPVQTSVLGSAATMYQTYNIAFVNAIAHEIGKDVRVNPIEAAKKAVILTGSIAAMNQMYSALGLDSPLPEPERAAWEWKESGRPAFDAIKPVMSELLSPTGITSGRSNPLIQNTRKIVAPSNKREFMEGLLNSIGAPTEIPGMIMRYNEEGKNVIPRQRRIVSASTK